MALEKHDERIPLPVTMVATVSAGTGVCPTVVPRVTTKKSRRDREEKPVHPETCLSQVVGLDTALSDIATAVSLLIVDGYLPLRRTQEENDALQFAEILGESHTVTLANSKEYPFNSTVSSPVTVALATTRKNLFYSVEANATAVEGGLIGDIHITDKALNGFKVSFDGSAKSVTLELRIKGGMVA